MPLYLGGILKITRIVFFAQGAMDTLPPPIFVLDEVVANHSMKKIPKEAPTKSRKRKELANPREETKATSHLQEA